MANYKSEQAAGRQPVVTPSDSSGGFLRYEYIIEANLAAGDVIELGYLPANKLQPLDATLLCDDLDAGAGIVMNVGILNDAKTGLGAGANDTWISGSTAAQSGGVSRSTTNAVYASGPQEFVRRQLGIVVSAAAATPQMIGKKVVLSVAYQA